MAYLLPKDLKELHTQSEQEAHTWREDYPQYERLADNGLMEGLDANLPEVNDGSLAAALFKLPKRIVSSKLTGTVKAVNRDEAWLSELANLQWQNEIIPNANSQAPFHRKWKDAVRKAAIYGSVPLITLFTERNGKSIVDFIVAQPQDVRLEAGKVSDYDSDVLFWDIYLTKLQLENMIEDAKAEMKEAKESNTESYNKWKISDLEDILKSGQKEERSPMDTPRQENNKDVRPKGFKFCIVVQRGVNAPFYMYYKPTDKYVREWSNPDPTGDVPIHFLYCYQDFINPYGIGIVKLAGGTQNVLDYMRQADVLATQLGLEPPINIAGDADSADLDSIVYSQRAMWFTGNAQIAPVETTNNVYAQLPERMSMYQASLNKLIPTGDTSTSQGSGDPIGSKTPAGVKLQAASLSIDDEDFKDNLYVTYEAVAKSMINTKFANMEGSDLMKLNDDEREILIKSGMEFPPTEDGQMSNEVEIVWDTARAEFDFEVDPEIDKQADDAQKLDGLMRVAELKASDPTLEQELAMSGKRLNTGELFSEIIKLTTDNDKIITDISPEEMAAQQLPTDPMTGQPIDPTAQAMAQPMQQTAMQPEMPQEAPQEQLQDTGAEMPVESQEVTPEEMQANTEAIMQEYGVDENTALAALAAEHQGMPLEDIMGVLQSYAQEAQQ